MNNSSKIEKVDDFNIGTLKEILSQCKRVFTNEAQFQFEMGKMISDRLCKHQNVLFEVLSVNSIGDDKKKYKKEYLDLVVQIDDKNYVAIELKYKIKGKTNKCETNNTNIVAYKYGDTFVFPQGAEDEGCYNFIKDISRLERIVGGNNTFINLPGDAKVKKGFAIMLTNSEKYWKQPNRKETSYDSLRLTDGKTINKEKQLNWKEGSAMRQKHSSISLNNEYTFSWLDYNDSLDTNGNDKFRYLIVEIPPKTNCED